MCEQYFSVQEKEGREEARKIDFLGKKKDTNFKAVLRTGKRDKRPTTRQKAIDDSDHGTADTQYLLCLKPVSSSGNHFCRFLKGTVLPFPKHLSERGCQFESVPESLPKPLGQKHSPRALLWILRIKGKR